MKKRCCVRYVSMVFSVVLVWLACPADLRAEVGVTENEILIGATMDLSGPIAFMGRQVSLGSRIYFDYINNSGGVYGRTVRLLVEDDMYQSPRAMQATRKLVTRDRVFCMFLILGSVQTNAMYPFLEAQKVPLVAPATQARQVAHPPRRYLFLADATYTTMAKIAIEYFVEEMGMKDPRIAVIYQDDTPGHDWLHGIEIAAGHYGLDVRLKLSYRRGAVDFSSQIARCRDADITHIYMWTLVREPALIMREAQRQNYRATYITALPSMMKLVLDLAGDAVDFAHGLYGAGNILCFEQPNEAHRLYMKNNKKYGPNDLEDANILYGYAAAINLVEGLRRAGPDLTREGLVEALETFDSFDNGINAPITWGPGLRDGARACLIGKAVDGRWVHHSPRGQWIYSRIEEY